MTTRGGRLVAIGAFVFASSVALVQCSKPAPRAQTAPPLWGDMTPVVSVRELMANMIDPFADHIFDAVWWEYTGKGMEAHRPRSDDDWQAVRVGAVTVAEGIYLLKVRRAFTPPGDLNDSVGPNPAELSPTQIAEKLAKDTVLWDAKIEAVRNVTLATLDAVNRKDVDALFQAGADLDAACEGCHLEYWYPRDKNLVDQEKKARVTFEKPRPSGR